MADISTAVSMARVPILGENGRISDDYIPAAIGENATKAESAAKRAETAATNAEGSATAARQNATGAQGSASAAGESANKAQESATAASGAVTQAQSAQQAAEAAKTGAESARGSAQTAASQAQQSATAAAESAANVADKFISSAKATTLEPGSQATASVADQVLTLGIPRGDKGDKGDTGEKGDPGDVSVVQTAEGSDLSVSTDEGTVTIDDSTLRERIAELENQAANVLKGTLGPAPMLSADDAYATKPRKLTVNGATRQNLWVNPRGTANGVTVTGNDDGSFTIGGTLVGSAASFRSPKNIYTLKPNTQYTLSIDKPIASSYVTGRLGACVYVNVLKSDGSYLSDYIVGYGSKLSLSFTTGSEFSTCVARINVFSNDFNPGTYRVMLNEGSEPEPWCPPGLNSVDELSLMTAGKNLLKFQDDLRPIALNGLTFTPNEDGTITVNGTATANDTDYYIVGVSWGARADANFPASDLVFSTNGIAKMYGYDSDGATVISAIVNNGQSQIAASKAQACAKVVVYLSYAAGKGESNKRVYVQLELGSTATAYEPPNVTTTPIDLDGNTLCSLPDGTHDELTIDATGAVTLTKRTWSDVFDGTENWQDNTSRYSLNTGATFATTADTVVRDKQLADTLPVVDAVDAVSGVNGIRTYSSRWVDVVIASMLGDLAGFKAWLGNNNTTLIYKLAEPQTIPLPPVTLPTLPAPTVNVWADAEASGAGYAMGPDVELEYERDVTIAFDKLQAQVSATTVREATNG